MKLSIRLETAMPFSEGFVCLRDVGCDHAFFAMEAVLRGNVLKAVASDNKKGPLAHAVSHVKDAHLEDKVTCLLADGLHEIQEDQDVVSILGMGGIVIRKILEEGDLSHVKRLILSPNSDAFEVRTFLEENGFMIIYETMIEDKGKYYQIIISERGTMKLSKIEQRFGRQTIEDYPIAFHQYLKKTIKSYEKEIDKIKQIDSLLHLKKEIECLKEIYHEWN